MPAVIEVEAEMELADAGVRVFSSRWPSSHVENTFSGERHLLAMYLPKVGAVEGRYCDDDGADYAPLGSLFFRPANRTLHVRGKNIDRKLRAVHCSLDDRWLRNFGSAVSGWPPSALQSALNIREHRVRPYLLRILSETIRPGLSPELVIEASLILLINDVLTYLTPWQQREVSRCQPSQDIAKIVRERVYDLQQVTPTVRELAELCCLSERHVLRLFKEAEGVSVVKFIRMAKLERAIEMLSDEAMPLKVIAHYLGYSGHAAFTAAFTKDVGINPSEFRRDRRKMYFQKKSTSAKLPNFHSVARI